MTTTFSQLMNRRRALNDSIKFEEPGSEKYKKLDQQIRDIDDQKFNTKKSIQ